MSPRQLNFRWTLFTLFVVTAVSITDAQDRARKEAEAKAQAERQRVNQLEKRYKQFLGNLNEINSWLEKNRGDEFAEKREQMMGEQKELMAAVEKIKAEFAEMRRRNQEKEREQNRSIGERRELSEQQNNANRLERLYKEYSAQLEDINEYLEKNRGDEFAAKREELLGNRRKLMAALQEIKAYFAARKKKRENQEGAREYDRVHPEAQEAMNRLKHFEHAAGHLREAGAGEIAELVEQRADKMREIIERSQDRRKAEQEHARKRELEKDRSRNEKSRESDEEFRKEVIGAIRELNSAVMSLRKEIGDLKRGRR